VLRADRPAEADFQDSAIARRLLGVDRDAYKQAGRRIARLDCISKAPR
jgi:hypothetical protein